MLLCDSIAKAGNKQIDPAIPCLEGVNSTLFGATPLPAISTGWTRSRRGRKAVSFHRSRVAAACTNETTAGKAPLIPAATDQENSRCASCHQTRSLNPDKFLQLHCEFVKSNFAPDSSAGSKLDGISFRSPDRLRKCLARSYFAVGLTPGTAPPATSPAARSRCHRAGAVSQRKPESKSRPI